MYQLFSQNGIINHRKFATLLLTKHAVVILTVTAVICGVTCVSLLATRREAKPTSIESFYKNLLFLPGTKVYDYWKQSKTSTLFHVTPFAITNAFDVQFRGHKPTVQQTGSVVFRERIRRTNVTFSSESPPRSVTFQSQVTYEYLPDLSNASIEAYITVPNLAYLNGPFDSIHHKPFVNCSIRDALWGCSEKKLKCQCHLGLLPEKQSTTTLTIDTGTYNITAGGTVREINGASILPVYDQEEASTIHGSEGIRFQPGLSETSVIQMQKPHLCRPLTLKTQAITNTKVFLNDLEVLRFGLPSSTEMDSTQNVLERIFCSSTEACAPKGMFKLQPCQDFGVDTRNIYVSKPMFTDTDIRVKERVNGVPESSSHQSIYHVEPNTGVLVGMKEHFQYSAYLSKFHGELKELKKNVYVPTVWTVKSMTFDRTMIEDLRKILPEVQRDNVHITDAFAPITGIVTVVAVILLLVRHRMKSHDVIKQSNSLPYMLQYIDGSVYSVDELR